MSRYIQNLLAAVVTFVLGVFVATSLPRFADLNIPFSATHRPCDQVRNSGCNEWETTGPVTNGLGWDLTYTSLLRNSGICPGDVYCEIAPTKPQPPVHKLFAEWKGEPIVSSILIELPDGHAAMFETWLVRTTTQAYVRTFHPDHETPDMQPLPTQDYDRAFETMTCWQQDQPLSGKFFDGHTRDGYVGFLSLFKDGRSRQMLLTYTDLFLHRVVDDKDVNEANWGRLWKILQPIYSALEEKQREQAAKPKNKLRD